MLSCYLLRVDDLIRECMLCITGIGQSERQ